MGTYEQLNAAISAVIKQNGNQEITGNVLQAVLKSIVNSIGVGATFAGVATPSTNPQNPDQNVFYIASTNGTYTNFDDIEVNNEIAILSNASGDWEKYNTGAINIDALNAETTRATTAENSISNRIPLHHTGRIVSEAQLNTLTGSDAWGIWDCLIAQYGYGIAIIGRDFSNDRTHQTLITQSTKTGTSITIAGASIMTRTYDGTNWSEWQIMPIETPQKKFVLPFYGIVQGQRIVRQIEAPSGARVVYLEAYGAFAAESSGQFYGIFPDMNEYQSATALREGKLFVYGNSQYSVFNGVWTQIL